MKTKNLVLAAIALVLAFGMASCKNEIETKEYLITFEDLTLGETGYWNGSDGSGLFTDKMCDFVNSYSADWGAWMGFAYSSLTDTETAGMDNQYSVAAGAGANNSKQFALAYSDNAEIKCGTNEFGYFNAKSIMLTNTTYAYLAMKNGDTFTKLFADGDWFKVIMKGYKGTSETGSVDYYLADFREGKAFISKQWEKVDISSLGEIDKIIFSFDSSDKGEYGMNNPAYVCIDNMLFIQEIEE